ncbi:MAG: glycosyltransferase family 4 protein, partial [Actinobacteria bacterium]|nr:glycosyltransferase family 4 protein [Actinomycetota bacterium]
MTDRGARLRRLLVVSQYWEPAELAGGARSTARVVAALGDDVETWVVAGDRDVGDLEPWPALEPGWQQRRGRVRVQHQAWDRGAGRRVADAVAEVEPDLVYLPSLFAPGSLAVLWRRAVGRLRVPVVVAPEGELHPGALAHHAGRKRAVVVLVRAAGLGRRLWWRAADDAETEHLRAALGRRTRVRVAPDLHDPPQPVPATALDRPKVPGSARVVLLGSIVPKKGPSRALELLWPLRHQVRVDLYGPAVDADEWGRCRAILDRVEPEVAWAAHGPVGHAEVPGILAAADLLVLPTLGENYGYALAEALEAGCPVLTSDQTPWRDLAADGCGWDLPLDPAAAWTERVREVVAWDAGAREAARRAA